MSRLRARGMTLLLVLIVMALNLGVWALFNRPVKEAPWIGTINSVSWAPYQANQSPIRGDKPTPEDMDHDLAVLSREVAGVRTYSALDGQEKVPELARKYGMKVIAGAWIDANAEKNEREIQSLIKEAKNNRNITSLIVGNEAVLRGEMTASQMAELIKRVKAETHMPVSTAEIWQNWRDHPELADAADYLAVHVLPYWEGVPVDEAVTHVMESYDLLHKLYPDKPIMISEVGWPSAGPWLKAAEPSLVNQSRFIREFLNMAREKKLTYTIMEGIDQPWKQVLEGPAGTAWGLLKADRTEKFPMVGAVTERGHWPMLAAMATLLALPAMLWFVARLKDLRFSGRLFYAGLIQAVASIFVFTVNAITSEAFVPWVLASWTVLMATQLVLFLVVLSDGLEFAEVMWREEWHRRVIPTRNGQGKGPKVSVHVPCYNEPAEMVQQTLDHLAALDYPDYEVLLIDNNTKDPAVWKPVEAHCALLNQRLGFARFRFFHLDNWPGYKAGALNFGLKQTAPDAEIVAVIDSDYLVDRDWLAAMVPNFDDPQVGLVQSPQDYHSWADDPFKRMIFWEYAGFFAIGMVQRNERNAIIQHGTMTMMRKSALVGAGGWAEWCITEDADLGLTLFEQGWQAIYAPDSFGRGVVPDSLSAYKTQRFRWAYGAVQIVKRHWRNFLPWAKTRTKLTGAQQYHFVAGWLPWFADAAALLFAAASVLWSIGIVLYPPAFGFPPTAFMIPTIAAFLFKVAIGFRLYQTRIRCSWLEKIGAAIAGMGLTYTVGRAVWQGLFTSGRPFVRTPKMADQPALVQGFLMARDEILWLAALWIAAFAVVYMCGIYNRDALMWSIMLAVQSLPFIAALITAMVNALGPVLARKRPSGALAAGAD